MDGIYFFERKFFFYFGFGVGQFFFVFFLGEKYLKLNNNRIWFCIKVKFIFG